MKREDYKPATDSLGIDISKLTIDVCLYHSKEHHQFSNSQKGFELMKKWLNKKGLLLEQLVICFEHTGWYCLMLSHYLHQKAVSFHCVNPLQIKRSIGLKRGKTDKADAFEISRFAWLHREELEPSVPMSLSLVELQRMMSLRELLVRQATALKNQFHGMKVVVTKCIADECLKTIKQTIIHIKKQLLKIETEMESLIKKHEDLLENYQLCRTVKGVGPILSIQLLLHTHNFTRFKVWRQFSAYCGLAPYPYESGTAIKWKDKIHPICDHKMKSLLSMCAIVAMRHDKELKAYFEKRLAEGKHKMTVINIIRNKIVARVFAVVKRKTPYVELHQHLA